MKMNVELDDDMTSDIVQTELKDAYEWLKSDFLRETVAGKSTNVPMYSVAFEEEMELKFQLINALRLAHNYFSSYKDRITW